MKKQVPNKRQTPAQIREAARRKRAQEKFDKPLLDKRTTSQIQSEKWEKLQDQTNFSRKSPEFGQDKAWVREGREPSWSKDREHLMKIFKANVEKELLDKNGITKDFHEKLERRHLLRLAGYGQFDEEGKIGIGTSAEALNWKETRWLKEYEATGLGDMSRAMRLYPVPITGQTKKDYEPAAYSADRFKKDIVPTAPHFYPKPKWLTASSVPWGILEGIVEEGEPAIILDHNRNKKLDTPAVKREMAHYDQLHALLKKQDAGVRALVNVFHGGFLGR